MQVFAAILRLSLHVQNNNNRKISSECHLVGRLVVNLCYFRQILLLSMKDMNVAKLTSQDLPLFNGVVSDLFPGVETPTIDYGKVSRTSHFKLTT